MQIQPDVHWIEGRGSNLFLCVDEDGLTLIDCGMPNELAKVASAVAEINYTLTDIKRILITHADIDHIGSAAAIQVATGAPIYTSAASAEHLIHRTYPKHLPPPAQWALKTFMRPQPIPADQIQIIAAGNILPVCGGLEMILTPGHTPDHVSFYSKSQGVLFAGDALDTRNDTLNRTPKRITADQTAANLSAIKLLELAPAVFACGHGTPMQTHTMDDTMGLFNQLRQALEIS